MNNPPALGGGVETMDEDAGSRGLSPEASGDTDASSFHYSGTELTALAEADNYYGWLQRTYAPWLRGRVVEVGAGIGTFSRRIEALDSVDELTLLEPAANIVEILRRRFAANPRVRVIPGYFGDVELGGPVDAIVLVNVLEHIEEDAGFVRQAWESLREGGTLMLFVPAVPGLYGTLDVEFEHYRRYTRRGLRRLLEEAGYRIDKMRYANLPGIVPWWVAGHILRKRTIRPAEMRLYDRLVIPATTWLEDRIAPPIGQSLLAVVTKEESR